MKHTFILCALAIFNVPLVANAQNSESNIVQPAPFAAARSSWNDVREEVDYLDEIVAQKKLSEVHDTAFNIRDNVQLLASSQNLSAAQKEALRVVLEQIATLANALDASGDNNDLRATTKNQRQMHVLLDQIAAIFPAGALLPIGAVRATSAVKDPVCRMTVEPTTAPSTVVYAGQTYYFCSPDDARQFQTAPQKYAALYEELSFGAPKQFQMGLHASDASRPKVPIRLAFAVREKESDQLVSKFELVHEKQMHLIAVSEDLSWFAHVHPQQAKDGKFYLDQSFPRPGRYLMFADFTPADGLNQIKRSVLEVGGGQPHKAHLMPDKTLSKTVAGYQISLQLSRPLQAGRPSLLTYTLRKNGRDVNDLEMYLGASGHMMAISQNGQDAVHTHTVGEGGQVTPQMATSHGPRVTYDLALPTSGLYKIWAQFQHRGQVITVPFTFNVAAPSVKAPQVLAEQINSKMQSVTVKIDGGYTLSQLQVRGGEPLQIVFERAKDEGCGNVVVFPDLNLRRELPAGRTVLTVTPPKSGTLKFTCGMGMYQGALIVK